MSKSSKSRGRSDSLFGQQPDPFLSRVDKDYRDGYKSVGGWPTNITSPPISPPPSNKANEYQSPTWSPPYEAQGTGYSPRPMSDAERRFREGPGGVILNRAKLIVAVFSFLFIYWCFYSGTHPEYFMSRTGEMMYDYTIPHMIALILSPISTCFIWVAISYLSDIFIFVWYYQTP